MDVFDWSTDLHSRLSLVLGRDQETRARNER